MASHTSNYFAVKFSESVVRVLECETPHGRLQFTLDSGSTGDRSICLEHHPSSLPRVASYDQAFNSAKQYLESCGYEVEIHGR
jgi:hypothetical protein